MLIGVLGPRAPRVTSLTVFLAFSTPSFFSKCCHLRCNCALGLWPTCRNFPWFSLYFGWSCTGNPDFIFYSSEGETVPVLIVGLPWSIACLGSVIIFCYWTRLFELESNSLFILFYFFFCPNLGTVCFYSPSLTFFVSGSFSIRFKESTLLFLCTLTWTYLFSFFLSPP